VESLKNTIKGGIIMENQTHLGAVAEITEMLYVAKQEVQEHLGAVASITEMLYYATHKE
jgi:hypothetical protein